MRALAASAYRHGAKFVDPVYFDMHVKRARILHAEEDTLDFVPSWYGERMLELGRQRCARIGIAGPATPGLLERPRPRPRRARPAARRRRRPASSSTRRRRTGRSCPFPTRGWARQVHPGPRPRRGAAPPGRADRRTSAASTRTDPVAAWRERADVLVGAAARADRAALHRAALRGRGHRPHGRPAADVEVHGRAVRDGRRHPPHAEPPVGGGLRRARPAAHRRRRARDEAARRRRLDRPRPRGRVPRRAARCASTPTRAATSCAATPRATRARRRLGEVALVDGEGRIGRLGTTFFDTLLDENAASHIALGQAYAFTAGEEDQDAPEPLRHPRRLHDRRRRRRRERRHRRRRRGPRPARRRLADLSARRGRPGACRGAPSGYPSRCPERCRSG